MRTCVLFCLLFISWVGPAFALSVRFDLASNPDTLEFNKFGLHLNLSADSLDNDGSIGGHVTWFSDKGAGVDAVGKNDGKTLDSSGSDDLLSFDFSSRVGLLELVFSSVGPDDEVLLLVDGVRRLDEEIDAALTTSSNVVARDFSSSNFLGKNFSLMAIDSNDSFRVKSITVDYQQTPVPTPEPSTWLLLGSGLAGLVYWRRRNAGGGSR